MFPSIMGVMSIDLQFPVFDGQCFLYMKFLDILLTMYINSESHNSDDSFHTTVMPIFTVVASCDIHVLHMVFTRKT